MVGIIALVGVGIVIFRESRNQILVEIYKDWHYRWGLRGPIYIKYTFMIKQDESRYDNYKIILDYINILSLSKGEKKLQANKIYLQMENRIVASAQIITKDEFDQSIVSQKNKSQDEVKLWKSKNY